MARYLRPGYFEEHSTKHCLKTSGCFESFRFAGLMLMLVDLRTLVSFSFVGGCFERQGSLKSFMVGHLRISCYFLFFPFEQ